jgi:methionyl aminopeptidase
MSIIIKSEREIALMREAGRIVGNVLKQLKTESRAGMTTLELDDIARRECQRLGGKCSFKGYRGFPGHLCVSLNDQIVHGIPGSRVLEEGDLVSCDFGVILRGFQGDAALSYGIGRISAEAAALLEVTEASLTAGINACQPGNRLGDIGAAVQDYAEQRGYGVVREYTGHGIGREMHEEPQVPNFGTPGDGSEIRPGMVLALEPMINIGGWRTRAAADGWTVYTADGSLSAHFEHTVAVTPNGPEILTLPD